MKPKLLFLFLIFNFSFCIVATATIRYVSKTGSATPPYTSWATASDSISKALNLSMARDTVYIGSGVYTEHDLVLGQGVALIGMGMNETKITYPVSNKQLMIMHSGATLKNIHLERPKFINNLPILFLGSLGLLIIIDSCKFEGGSFAISIAPSPVFNVHIKNNVFLYQESLYWGGVSNNFIIDNNIFINNHEVRAIAQAFNSSYSVVVTNNLMISEPIGSFLFFVNAEASNNIAVSLGESQGDKNYYLSGGKLINDISYGSFNNGVVYLSGNNAIPVKNNVIMNSESGIRLSAPATQSVQYNNVWNVTNPYINFTPDSTNISVDPMFMDEDSVNFLLQKFSKMIDAGDPNLLDVDGTRSDIGAFGGPFGKSYDYLDIAPKAPRGIVYTVSGDTVKMKWKRNTESDFSYYRVHRDSVVGFIPDSTNILEAIGTDTAYTTIVPNDQWRKVVYKVTAVDSQGNQSKGSQELVINIVGGIDGYQVIPLDYELYQNYPNPFNPETILPYRLKERGYVRLKVYDLKGELVTELVDEEQEAGYYEVSFNAETGGRTINERLASGIYFYGLEIKNSKNISVYSSTKKMVLIK